MDDIDLLKSSPLFSAKEGSYMTKAVKAQTHADGSHTVEYEVEEQFFDEDEQNLEEGATAMLDVWNRENLFNPCGDITDNPMFPADEEAEDFMSFEILQEHMRPIHEDQVFMRIIHSNPDGQEVTHHSSVLYDAVGYLEYNDNPFDNSISRGVPMFHRLHRDIVLPGLKIGLMNMRQGEKAHVLIKPKYAFRELGVPPRIPPNSTVLFSISLHKTWKESALDDYLALDTKLQDMVPIDQRFDMCLKHKNAANQFFRDQRLKEAIIRYRAAIKCLDEFPSILLGDKNSKEAKLLSTLLGNALVIYNKLRMPRAASKTARRLLDMEPDNLKALYGMAKAKICLAEYDTALEYVDRATRKSPENRDFNNLKLELDFQKRDDKKKSDELMVKMSKAFAS